MPLTPITRKRLHRFRRHSRAFVSAWLFGGLFVLVLAADLLCNSKPLLVRVHGKTLFPILRFYPESVLLPDGGPGNPDYKALQQSDLFQQNPKHFMLFAPVPYGPAETIDEAKFAARSDRFRVRLQPVPRAASIDIDASIRVVRHVAAGFFLSKPEAEVVGTRLDSIWPLDGPLRKAIRTRFQNKAAPELQHTVEPVGGAGQPISLSLPAFSPRPRAPRFVRLTLRLPVASPRDMVTVAIHPEQGAIHPPAVWHELRPEDREQIRILDPSQLARSLPIDVQAGTDLYRVFPAAGITWPHPPTPGHWLGIDGAGRDVLARIVHGLRVSLLFGLLLVVASMGIGTIIGAVQGYYGGVTDIFTQRIIEIWSAIPFLYVMILLGSIYGASFGLLLFCYAIFNWIGISYFMRAEFLRLRHAAFVDAARAQGLRNSRIILRHILPNALTPIITFAPFSLVGAIAALAALDYLGFGLPSLTPSLGQLLHQAQTYRTAWWLTLYPSLALFVVILLGVFIGEGIRDAWDPRPPTRLE